MYDGDLWETFWNFIWKRGPYSAWFGKTKGHATDQMVIDGKVRHFDNVHNDVADSDATRAIHAHGHGVKDMARWLAARHNAYNSFMHQIHRVIIATHRADQHARQVLKKANGLKGSTVIVVPKCIKSANEDEGQYICFGPMPLVHLHSDKQHLVSDIMDFYSRYKFAPVGYHEAGVCWIELLAAYDLGGGSMDLHVNADRNDNPSMARAGIQMFMDNLRDITKHIFQLAAPDFQKNGFALASRGSIE